MAAMSANPGSLRTRRARDGTLKQVAWFVGKTCRASLDLDERREWGLYRHGVAGEEFSQGRVQPVGPFVGGGKPRRFARGFAAWVKEKLAELQKLSGTAE